MSDYSTGECAKFGNGRNRGIISLGPDIARIRIGKRTYHFEWHRIFGPSLLKADGTVLPIPGEYHPFWHAVTLWDQQGRRMDNGLALWEG